MSATLVTLHGFAGSPASFHGVCERLADDLPVTGLTLLGHGKTSASERVPDDASFEAEVDRLLALLSPSIPSSHYLLGYSMGARLALGLLARHRRWFRGALLIGVHPGLLDDAARAARLRSDEAWSQLLEERGLEAFVEAWQAQPLFASQAVLPAPRRVEQQRQRLSHDPRGLASALRHLGLGRMPNYEPLLPELRLPITLMVGALDTKFCELGETMLQRLPQAKSVVVQGVGHNVVLEHPAAVARAVIEGIAQ